MTQILIIPLPTSAPALQSSESSLLEWDVRVIKKVFSVWVGVHYMWVLAPGVCIHVGPVSVSCLHGQVWPGSGPGRERRVKRGAALPVCCLLPGAGDQHRPRSALQFQGGAAETHHLMPAAGPGGSGHHHPPPTGDCSVSFPCCEDVWVNSLGRCAECGHESEGQFTLDTQHCHYNRRNVSRNSDKDCSWKDSDYTLAKGWSLL